LIRRSRDGDWARVKVFVQSVVDQVKGMNDPSMINEFLQKQVPEINLQTGTCGIVMTIGSLSSVIWDMGFIVLFVIVLILLGVDLIK
jgi:hypothetical protein